jgi:predicted RecA/RadA family phage recombinase
MSNTFVQSGARVDYYSSGGNSAGDVVVRGIEIGVVVADIAALGTGPVDRAGVHVLAATIGIAWNDAVQLYWDASGSKLTTVATGHNKAGIAVGSKASAAATANVLINGNCACAA